MLSRFSGRQPQFYIDLVYGLAFSFGFGYLLFVGMDPRIAAFQGGLVLGYFLRVWENMTVYEQILQEEVTAEVEQQVPEEVTAEVEQQVPEEVSGEVEEEVQRHVGQEVEDHIDDRLAEKVREQINERVDEEALQQSAQSESSRSN